MAGLWCSNRMRFNYFSAGKAVWRTLLALTLLMSPGYAQIAQPSEGATPPLEQPAYAALAAKYFSETMADRLSFENFKISELPRVHFVDHGHLRAYAAVHTEQCRDRRTLRRSSGFVRIAIIHAVRRGYRHAQPGDRAATAGAVLACPRPLARLRSTQAARRSLHERRARPPA